MSLIETFPTREALYEAAADLLVSILTEDVAASGRSAFAAPGGTTPAPVFERMARREGPWSRIAVTLTDERWTPPTSPLSNEALLRRTLLTGRAACAPFTPLWSDAADPEAAAQAAQVEVAKILPFGAVLLGMGGDGHIASLFPGSEALSSALDAENKKICVAVRPGDPAPDIWRLSLTLAALTRANLVVLLITGQEKRALLQSAPKEPLPVHALLQQAKAPLRVLWAE